MIFSHLFKQSLHEFEANKKKPRYIEIFFIWMINQSKLEQIQWQNIHLLKGNDHLFELYFNNFFETLL